MFPDLTLKSYFDIQSRHFAANTLPAAIPNVLAMRPANCGGNAASGAMNSIAIQQPNPSTMESTAPRLLARFQYSPATSGTKAQASVTL